MSTRLATPVVPGHERDMDHPSYFKAPVHRYSPLKELFCLQNVLILLGIAACLVVLHIVFKSDTGVAPDLWKVR
jgi:hypothetical protein